MNVKVDMHDAEDLARGIVQALANHCDLDRSDLRGLVLAALEDHGYTREPTPAPSSVKVEVTASVGDYHLSIRDGCIVIDRTNSNHNLEGVCELEPAEAAGLAEILTYMSKQV